MNTDRNSDLTLAQQALLRVDVFSDVICPWCFIGKRRLDTALNGVSARYEHRVTWRPFQLNPAMPRVGVERPAYLDAKFGGPEARQALEQRITSVGKTEGIAFAFDRIHRTPNTFDAHRLIWLAQREACQDAVVEELFRRYFLQGDDIGDRHTLLDVAQRAGISPLRAKRLLESDEGADGVREEEQQGRRTGITGVPFFLINESRVISGAQPADTFASAFTRAMS